MAITNATAVKFCNDKVRPSADKLSQAYYNMRAFVDEWVAAGMSALIPNDSTVVEDGSATDGRTVITGADVHTMVNRASELLTDYDAASKAKLNTIIKVAVNKV